MLIRRIVALDPNNLVATNELTLILLGKGSLAEAEHHARNAVRIAPENPQAHNLMGMIMTEANRPQIGEYHYRRVLELAGQRDPILLANLAWNLENQGRMKEARALYEESVTAAPQVRQTLPGFARLEEADRNFDAAAKVLDKADTQFPNDQGVRLTCAVLLGRMRRYDEALAIIASVRAMLAFAGEAYNKACLTFHKNRRYAHSQLRAGGGAALQAFVVSPSPLLSVRRRWRCAETGQKDGRNTSGDFGLAVPHR